MSLGTEYRTQPPTWERPEERRTARPSWWRSTPLVGAVIALLLAVIVLVADDRVVGVDGEVTTLTTPGTVTLLTFLAAVWAWAFTDLDDTFVALVAGTALVITGVLGTERLFATLGDDTIWLLVSAFVIAAGVTTSGLATRAAAWLMTGAHTLRGLAHLVTGALVVTTFAIPATSGRAALALPVFLALARVLGPERARAVRALALIFPTVILLSAVGSLLGAGAHLVTVQVLQTATGETLNFAEWLVLGLPLAVVSSHLATELVLLLFLDRAERRQPVRVGIEELAAVSETPLTGPLTVAETRAAMILCTVVVLWCTQSLHGIHPAIVALIGALVTASPRFGSTKLKDGLRQVPWSLLLFMAATLALGDALITSGAADWLAASLLTRLGITSAVGFIVMVVVLSTAAHLMIQSRSARSAVLVPIVVALAPTVGVSPVAAAFASTAAAGFCHTLPASAKPVAMFAAVEDVPTYSARDLRRLSLVLAPVSAALVVAFSLLVWPHLGLPL
ncbi:anion permease [Nocardioides rotundus]|uniref:SLC13 family permease n=1 Tax=Nocardioides rotundus TaxID=1774216 RepID=UPI001CBD68D7|nr:SLC13 family permease [Nocardioides rotundus]UAL29231.1 anion permease [Nocardioides rotundus]